MSIFLEVVFLPLEIPFHKSMSVFKLQVGNHFGVPVETISRDMTLPQYIQSKITFREASMNNFAEIVLHIGTVCCVSIYCCSLLYHMQDNEEPFYVVDLGQLVKLHDQWTSALPKVWPFYAVKCNEDLALLKTLAALGTGFDCASKVSH